MDMAAIDGVLVVSPSWWLHQLSNLWEVGVQAPSAARQLSCLIVNWTRRKWSFVDVAALTGGAGYEARSCASSEAATSAGRSPGRAVSGTSGTGTGMPAFGVTNVSARWLGTGGLNR